MKILLIEDDEITRSAIKSQLENPGVGNDGFEDVRVTGVGSQTEAEAALEKDQYQYALIDLKLGQDRMAGSTLLKNISKNYPTIIPIMMTSNTADSTVEDCLRFGAADYIYKPFDHKSIHLLLRKARIIHKIRQYGRSLKANSRELSADPVKLTSKNKKFQETIALIDKLRGKPIDIFITGESGSGKDIAAQYLSYNEGDPNRVFIAVNSGSIPVNLLESELFGHKKGSFTGADQNKIGKFEAADGGDIFLDEVATLLPENQVKLLRVLDSKKITPIGSNTAIALNVRVIAATNESLEDLVASKKFREDLLYRLKSMVIEIPPLRERMEDLEDLVFFFLKATGNSHMRLSNEAWELCRKHSWPGNIRELKKAIENACAIADGNEIQANELRPSLQRRVANLKIEESSEAMPFGLSRDRIKEQFNPLTEEFEQSLFKFAFKEMKSIQGAAKFLGISRNTLNYKLKSWGWSRLDE